MNTKDTRPLTPIQQQAVEAVRAMDAFEVVCLEAESVLGKLPATSARRFEVLEREASTASIAAIRELADNEGEE